MEHRENSASLLLPAMPPPRKARHGCIVQVLAALAFGVLVVLAVDAITAPWSFYMGGQFHIIPSWTGWGRMHSKLAGDYILYVSLSPTSGGRTGRNVPHIKGQGILCTPRGELYKLHLGGDFGKPSGTDLQGTSAYLYMYNYRVFSGSTAPSLEFRGKWNNPHLVLDDHGSLTRAFDPGGALVTNHRTRPYMQEVVPITLHQGDYSDFKAACAAMKAK